MAEEIVPGMQNVGEALTTMSIPSSLTIMIARPIVRIASPWNSTGT